MLQNNRWALHPPSQPGSASGTQAFNGVGSYISRHLVLTLVIKKICTSNGACFRPIALKLHRPSPLGSASGSPDVQRRRQLHPLAPCAKCATLKSTWRWPMKTHKTKVCLQWVQRVACLVSFHQTFQTIELRTGQSNSRTSEISSTPRTT